MKGLNAVDWFSRQSFHSHGHIIEITEKLELPESEPKPTESYLGLCYACGNEVEEREATLAGKNRELYHETCAARVFGDTEGL